MQFGPYPQAYLDVLTGHLKALGIPHQVVEEPKELDSCETQVCDPTSGGGCGQSDPGTHCIEIEDQVLKQFAPQLKQLGIADYGPLPDFGAEDYCCPKCSYYTDTQGTCPKHGLALIPWSEHKKIQESMGGLLGSFLKMFR